MDKNEKIRLAQSLIEQIRSNLNELKTRADIAGPVQNSLSCLDTLQNLVWGVPVQEAPESASIEELEEVSA